MGIWPICPSLTKFLAGKTLASYLASQKTQLCSLMDLMSSYVITYNKPSLALIPTSKASNLTIKISPRVKKLSLLILPPDPLPHSRLELLLPITWIHTPLAHHLRNSPGLGMISLHGITIRIGLQTGLPTGGLKDTPTESLAGLWMLLLNRHARGNKTKESARLSADAIPELEA